MTEHEVRREVKALYPHFKLTIRTVHFSDLARASRKCLKIEGDRNAAEVLDINLMARSAGIIPDGNLRFYWDN